MGAEGTHAWASFLASYTVKWPTCCVCPCLTSTLILLDPTCKVSRQTSCPRTSQSKTPCYVVAVQEFCQIRLVQIWMTRHLMILEYCTDGFMSHWATHIHHERTKPRISALFFELIVSVLSYIIEYKTHIS